MVQCKGLQIPKTACSNHARCSKLNIKEVWQSPASGTIKKGNAMPMYEATVRTPQGDTKDRVYAKDLTEAKQLFEQRHGPRNVPYIPHVIPS